MVGEFISNPGACAITSQMLNHQPEREFRVHSACCSVLLQRYDAGVVGAVS